MFDSLAIAAVLMFVGCLVYVFKMAGEEVEEMKKRSRKGQ